MIPRDFKKQQDRKLWEIELSASRQIGRKLQQLLWKDMRHFAEEWGFAAAIAYVLFLRAERSYSSIRTLARTRMADDAFALVRVMVEKIINGQYILLLGTETALDYIQYQAFREWRDLEELRSVEQDLVPEYSPENLNNLRAAYEAAKTKTATDGSSKERFGRGHDWIEIGLGKRAEKIDEILRQRWGAKSFKATQVLYHTTYKKSAAYLHGTWASVARSLELEKDDDVVGDEDLVQISIGVRVRDQDIRIAADAMRKANTAAISMLLFIARIFKKQKYLDWVRTFKNRYLEQRRETGKR